MAAYMTQQLNQIYTYIGFNHYITFDPEILSAILATQSVADGGDIPDTSVQTQLLSVVTALQFIDSQLTVLTPLFFASKSSSGSQIDPARADFMLRRQGRALIKQIVILLGIKGVRQDYYSRAGIKHSEDGGMSYFPGDNI